MHEDNLQSSSELSLRDYMDLLRRRRAIVIQTFIVVFVLGLAITFMAKPVYRTSARILVEGKSYAVNTVDANNPLNNLFMADTGHDIATQIEVLQGDKVLSDAYKDSDVPPGAAKLEVHAVNSTDVIELIVESNTPTYAERLAKTLPNTYLNYITSNRRTDITNAFTFAQNRYKEENDKLLKAELDLQRFKEGAGIVDAASDRGRRLAEVSSAEGAVQLQQSELSNDRVLLGILEQELKETPATLKATTQTSNPQIQAIKMQIDELRTQRAVLLLPPSDMKPTNPKVVAVDAQIRERENQLRNTAPLISSDQITPNIAIPTLKGKIQDLRASISTHEKSLATQQERLAKANTTLMGYGLVERQEAQLMREVDTHRGTVALLMKSVEDLRLRKMATHDPVLTIAPAGAAVQVAPKKLNNMVYASLIGLMLGLCFALLQEFLDDRINSPEDARRIVGSPALGYVPMIENEDARLLSGSRGGGSVLESYRVLRSNVRFAAVDTMIRSILVTSTVPGEGKSVTAYNLAVSMALDGRNVILVDTDLRRPTIHEKAKVSQQPGLTNVLVGHTAFEDAIKETNISGLRILSAGPLPPNPAELLNSQAMRQLHQTLKDNCDIVIFDSPPCLATADAQVLSAETDGCLYVVQFGEAKKSAVRHAVEMLKQARARVLGVVFNKIDLTAKRDAYYYGYYGYYGYYQTTQLEDGRPRRRRSTAEFEALLPKTNAGNGASPEETALTRTDTEEAYDDDEDTEEA